MAKIILSGQNFDIYEGDGRDAFARTGATSIEMLKKTGVQGVILGHSEVGDSPEITRKKLLTLLTKRSTNPNLFPYTTLLVGETWEDFSKQVSKQIAEMQKPGTKLSQEQWTDIEDQAKEQVAAITTKQLMDILQDTPKKFLENIVIGYEPKWGSRGSGHDDVPPPSSEFISACAREMKRQLTNTFGETGKQIPIIYGGKSTPERTEQILADENMSGLILGSACSTLQKTLDIAHAMEKVMGNRKKILHANFKAYNLPDSYEDYIRELKNLDDSFIVYLAPCHTDIREVKALI